MRKWILGVGVLALVVASTFVAAPAGASHGAEGTVTVGGVSLCSEMNAPETGVCSWTATDPNGWVGTGPFTITYDPPGATPPVVVNCAAGEFCQSADPDPIPAGSAVTTNGSGGGTFAAGDADEHNGM